METCLAKLRSLVARQPTLPPPTVMFAGMFLSVGRWTEAQQALEEAAAEGTQHPTLYLSFADIALAQNRLTDASVLVEKATAVPHPANWGDGEKAWLRAAALQRQIDIAERRGHWDSVQTMLTQLVESQPANPALRTRLAAALYRAGRQRQAYEQFDMAFQQQSQVGRPEIAMATLSSKLGNYADADRWYQKAVEAEPENPLIHWAWGMSLLLQNRAQEAAIHADAAEQLGLDSPALLLQKGIIARVLQQPAEAEAYLRELLQKTPNQPEATYHLVSVLLEQKDADKHAKALEIAEECAKLSQEHSLALAGLARALFVGGRSKEAETIALAAANSPSANPEALYVLGMILSQAKKIDDARRIAQRLQLSARTTTIFVERDAALKWAEEVLRTENADVSP